MTKSDSPLEGTQGAATPEGSNSSGNQDGRSAQKYLTIDDFNAAMEQFRRSMQSDKDKGVKRVEQGLEKVQGDMRTILERYAGSGKSVDDVLSDFVAEEERQARAATLELARYLREGNLLTQRSEGTGQQGSVNVSAVLEELELDASDTRVQEFRSRKFASEAEAYREAAKLVRKINSSNPNDADEPSREGKRTSQTSQEKLQQEYAIRSKGLYGSALVRLKAEMRQKGLAV